MTEQILVQFDNKKEQNAFLKEANKYYENRGDNYHLSYTRSARDSFKDFLYILGGIVLCACAIWFFVVKFQTKPEPIIKTNTITITGNTYNVSIDTKKLPAIGSLVYYYDSTISVQHGAKLNQIRVDSDGITRYNICTQQEQGDDNCVNRIDDKQNCDEIDCARICTEYNIPYDQCFDTSIIGSTEQQLKDGVCNK